MKSNKKTYYSKPTRKAHVAAWKTSGLSKAEYSREHGLSDKTFSRWVKEATAIMASSTTPASTKQTLVPVMPDRAKKSPANPLKDSSCLEINLPNGISIRSRDWPDLGSLSLLIKEIALCK